MTSNGAESTRGRPRKQADEPIESGTYTLPQAARRLGIGVRTAYDLHRRGALPVPVVQIGNQLRVRKSDLEAFLASSAAAS